MSKLVDFANYRPDEVLSEAEQIFWDPKIVALKAYHTPPLFYTDLEHMFQTEVHMCLNWQLVITD